MASTADRNTLAEHIERLVVMDLASGAEIFAGTQVSFNLAGEAVPAADAAATGPVVGRAAHYASYAAGQRTIEVERGVFWWKNSATDAVDANDVFKPCFVEDNDTVRETPGTHGVFAGFVERVESGVGVCVSLLGGFGRMPFLSGSFDTLAAPGAASLATDLTKLAVDGTDNHTLAAPNRRGQVKVIRTVSAANTPVSAITVTGGNGFTTISGFGAVSAFVILMASNADTPQWEILASGTVTFS